MRKSIVKIANQTRKLPDGYNHQILNPQNHQQLPMQSRSMSFPQPPLKCSGSLLIFSTKMGSLQDTQLSSVAPMFTTWQAMKHTYMLRVRGPLIIQCKSSLGCLIGIVCMLVHSLTINRPTQVHQVFRKSCCWKWVWKWTTVQSYCILDLGGL